MIAVIVNGQSIEFYEAKCTKSNKFGCGNFEFTVAGNTKTFSSGDKIEIEIDGTRVLNGKIEMFNAISNQKEARITYLGRDNSSSAIDSTFDKVIEFNRNLKLVDLLNTVLKPYQTEAIQENTTELLTQFELPTAEVGENVFIFCDKLCRTRESILTSNNDGSFLITTRGLNSANDILQFGTNIIEKDFTENRSILYDKYTVFSQNNSTLDNLNNDVNINAVVGSGTRTKGIIENNSLNIAECKARAEFERDLDIRNAFSYTAYIAGHSQSNGAIWEKNLKVSLRDDDLSINETVLIDTVCWVQSSSELYTKLILERIS